MSNNKPVIYIIFFLSLFTAAAFAQTDPTYISVKDTFRISLLNQYYISSPLPVQGTETILLNKKTLSNDLYQIHKQEGYISLNPGAGAKLNDTLIVSYFSYISSLKKEYSNRILTIIPETGSGAVAVPLVKEKPQSLSESLFGKGIQKSGSLIRGFQVSSNRDFTLNSGLRLQLSGRLSEDIEIVAALSDENIPIQPEGNTERLNEIDKVFIQIKHKNLTGTFGDYEMRLASGEFGKLSRKLQGLKGEFTFGDFNGIVSIASTRGKFNSFFFMGRDGNQGPYRLAGSNNENDITVIAGSEKVFVDGVEMRRGENNDYIVDYSSAQITFTSKRLITSASRINVDFEYTDRRFQRNFMGVNLNTKLFDGKMRLSFNYLRESDIKDNLIEYSLSDEEKRVLEQAGGDRNKGVISGISEAAPDSLGNPTGFYVKRDTVINASPFAYYAYAPNTPDARFNVVFSYVGEGNGDYSRLTLSNYKFAGIGKGSYLPIKYLPMPELKQNASFVIESEMIRNTRISLELAGSFYNANRFSSLDGTNKDGFAANLNFELKPVPVELFGHSLGKAAFSIKERYLGNNYIPFERINPVEFNREYNFNSDGNAYEELREINLNYFPSDNLALSGKYGMLAKGKELRTDRFFSSIKYSEKEISRGDFTIDYAKTENLSLKTDWNRQNGTAFYSLGIFRPGIDYLFDEKKETISGDSLISTSYRYLEAAPFMELIKIKGLDLRTQISFRQEFVPEAGSFRRQSDALLRSLKIGLRPLNEIALTLNLSLRNKYYTDQFKQKGYTDNETFLLYSQTKFNFFKNGITGDLYYEAATEQSAKQQKVFVKVVKGTGNYKYIGDVNGNGVADESDFELTNYDGEFVVVLLPTDQLFPVVDLKFSSRWNVELAKLADEDSFFGKILKPVSTETFFRIEENSSIKETMDIYLLKLSRFLNDSTTIRGARFFQQDLYLFRNELDFSLRARFTERRNLAQFAGGIEKGFGNEKNIRIRLQLADEIGNQTEFTAANDNYFSKSAGNRNREIIKSELSTDFTYRPVNNIDAGFKITTARIEDRFPAIPTEIDINSQIFRINFSFIGIGRLRIELERSEYVSGTSNFIPYEVTNGNKLGKNYYWRFYFDYRLAQNFSASVNYDGRVLGDSGVIHSLRAEARAFF